MADLAYLLVPKTEAEIEQTFLDLLASSGLPATAWQPGSTIRTWIGILAEVLSDAWFSVAQIANGVVLGTSRGSWLINLAKSQWDEQKTNATFTVGTLVLVDHGAGPHTITSGVHLFSTPTGVQFRAASSGTLNLNGTLEVTIQATRPGAASNVPNDSITTVVTSLPTVTCSNPPIGSTGTWITSLGADQMSDTTLQAVCAAKWATLATGSPDAAYLYWALTTTGVSRAKVDSMAPDGPSTVRVYVDNALSVATLQATLNGKVPAGSRATAVAATAQTVTIPGTVTVQASHRVQAEIDVVANLTALANSTDIGATIYAAEIVEQVMRPEGVVNFVLSGAWTGTPDLALGSSSYPQFTLALTWVETP